MHGIELLSTAPSAATMRTTRDFVALSWPQERRECSCATRTLDKLMTHASAVVKHSALGHTTGPTF